MAEMFLAKFFPPAKIAKLRSEIGQFKQMIFLQEQLTVGVYYGLPQV